jgi:GMP reductase
MDTTGTLEIATELSKHKLFTCLHKHYTDEEIIDAMKTIDHSYVAITTGINKHELDRAINLIKITGCKFICLDVANGYTEKFVESVKYVRQNLPNTTIIAGNVVTPDITYDLIKYSGVNIVKCGLINSPEKVLKTGIGYPQISAIMECADAAHEADGYLISDGGIRTTADLTKAFAAGADMVMAGGIFLNHLESPGDMCTLNGIEISQKNNNNKPLKSTILDINKNLKTACTYVNADNLDDFYLNSQFITIT